MGKNNNHLTTSEVLGTIIQAFSAQGLTIKAAKAQIAQCLNTAWWPRQADRGKGRGILMIQQARKLLLFLGV